MADSVQPQVIDDLTTTNVKTIAGAPAWSSNMMQNNAISNQQLAQNAATAHQQAMFSMREATMTEALGQRAGIDITESQAVRGVVASDLARQVTDAVLAALATKLVTPVT